MTDKLLDLEIRFLILRYGYEKVIKHLSRAKGITEEELQVMLSKVESKKVATKKKKKKTIKEITEQIINNNSEKADILSKLASRFENKTFLPQLKDVKIFLGRFEIKPQSLKSRTGSTKKVFEQLSHLSTQELLDLITDSDTNNKSTFSELASEIIGDRK